MATLISSFLKFTLFCFFAFLCLLCFLEKGCAYEGQETTETHHIQVNSLIPSTTCSPSTKGPNKKSSLKVVHKHGPCSELKQDGAKVPTAVEILEHDQSRAKSIRDRMSKVLASGRDSTIRNSKASTIPAKSGSTIGSGNYIVTVGLGTPTKSLSLIFDTGSDLTWTQCKPCVVSCYSQKEPTFDPTQSTTYTNITCNSAECSQLTSATGNSPQCSSSTCVYGIKYGDQSFSAGFFGKEKLTITSTDVFNGFLFGCGQNNQGLFGGSAGLLGLGRDPISLVQQTAAKYGKVFSYCLPSTSSSTGFLTLGQGKAVSSSVIYTSLSKDTDGTSFYGLDTTGISVGGQQLSISISVFSNAGTIIDSGTVITRLPPAAYTALRTAFRKAMNAYPLTSPLSLLDTCYDLSNYPTVNIPKISFFFSGGVSVPLDASGILYAQKISQVCLAFAGNSGASDVGIFGNVQQKRLEVVYDVAGGRVGFGSGGCS